MNAKKEQICRFCLKPATNGFQGIDETKKLLFNVLLLKLDLGKSKHPIVCQDCMEVAKNCLYFKSMCLDTEEIILSISVGERKSKCSIKFIYAKKEHIETINDENFDICRFCLTRLERNNFIKLDTLRIDAMFEMLTKCMPEMDFKITENPMICTTCRGSLEGYFQFLLNCLDIEDKIETYGREERSDNMGLTNLDDVPHSLFTNILGYPVKHQQIHKSKEEPDRLEDKECIYPEAYSELIKQEVLNENNSEFMPESCMIPLNIRELNIDGYTYRQEVQGNIMEDGSNHVDDLEAKWNDSSDIEINQHVNRTEEIKQTKCIASNFITTDGSSKGERNKYAEIVPVPGHSNVILIDIIKRKLQSIMSVQKMNINRQMSVHKKVPKIKMNKCSLCTHETKRRDYLKTHMLVHKNNSEIKSHKCSLCAYETKRKSDIKKHMLVHKDVSEIKMFKCPLCIYEAKHNGSLKQHMLVHDDVLEINKFKCPLCMHATKYKNHLKRHMLVHKDVSEIQMFKCSSCNYEAKRKSHLIQHMLVHKDISETEMYKCSLCTYQAKRKFHLKAHMSVHKDISEIKSYQCSFCAYKTKYKSDIKKHILVHKDISETEMYKCSLCAFETKHKRNVNKHMLVHEHV